MDRRMRRAAVAALVLLPWAVGVEKAAAGQDAVVLTEQEHRARVIIRPGMTMAVRLGAEPTDGHRWELAVADAAVIRLLDRYDVRTAPGGGGEADATQTFRFQTVAEGRTPLALAYVRGGNPSPAKTFVVEVEVRASVGR